ncbi:MAG TPA: BCAM0308 family protein [Blastocatellia bacterium]|nr:BCAM0308 family protein [Blastocatellia bacterium]
MHGDKRYSNATFTKRVDHEGGEHHTPQGAEEPALCQSCGAIYAEKRWMSAASGQTGREHRAWRPAKSVICPACKQEQEGLPGGFVYLAGSFLEGHRAEVEQLLENEAERLAEANPLARIMKREISKEGDLVLTTTTDHLAQHLGRAVEKAFGGDLKYVFSHENKLTRVYWRRD